MAGEPDRSCAGRPPICDRCGTDLAIDPAGPWCRTCRRAWPGEGRFPHCRMTAIATGATTRTAGLRLCRIHARRLVDLGGPGSVIPDPRTD